MKRVTLLFALIALVSFTFTSCEEDNYLDWKYMNEKWIIDHADDEGWEKTESGLYFRKIYEGIGNETPTDRSTVILRYKGSYINGKVFDEKEVGRMGVSGSVPGFKEALKMMKLNAKYEIRIPASLGYGKEKNGLIPPYSTLIFEVELRDFYTTVIQ